MSKRFGKKRVPGCECTERYTCGKCLADANPTKKLSGIPPEHDFTQTRDEWEKTVFDRASHFVVTRLLGYGKRHQTEFANLSDAFANAKDEPRALVYAIAPTGRFVMLPRDKWDWFLSEYDKRNKESG